jgi:diguanylate cyclase (GGDEF)-like protein/PAS domain S-box-containing protein
MNARPNANLMLVEDERIVAFDLKRQLQSFGYRVGNIVASGEQAIAQAAAEKPDLVLMDIHLDGRMDGIEAATKIRANHQIPVVFLTAYAEEDTLGRALDSRPFGYLVKPCEARELHATIQMALARHDDEIAVRTSRERLQLALDAGSLGVLEWNPSTNRLHGDTHLGSLFGRPSLPLDEAWDDFIARVDLADRERVRAALDPTLIKEEAVRVEFRTVADDASARHMEAHAKAFGRDGGKRVVGVLRDVTLRYKLEEQLRQSNVVFQATAEAIVISDAEQRIVAVNAAFSRITGYTEDEVTGRNPDDLLRVSPGSERYAELLESGSAGFWQGEVRARRKDGERFPAWQSVSVVRNAADRITHLVTAFSDVTAIYEAQQRINHLAHHDALTGLPNRLLFDDRLANAIELAVRNEQRCLLLFLDLDGFKLINDTLGHVIGDELLRIVGDRLRSVLRASDTVARLGGDEFVVLAGSTNPEYAAQLADKILEQLRLPIPVSGQVLSVTGSLGIAVFPENGQTSQQLMRAADMAMYTAKAEGRDRYHFYAEDMSARADERMQIEQGLRRAIASDGLVVHYQPRVNLSTRRIVGAEALVRWPHPERGMVLPDAFVSVAEESGIIEQLGRWVLQRACAETLNLVRERTRPGGEGFRLAVNVSARQLLGSDFVAIVESVLKETGFPPAALELEITESSLQSVERSVVILNALETLGVAIAIDDFGTGYSSLSVLRDLPINRIKLDRSFIVDLPENESQRAVVEAIVTIGHAMHMGITVEGIERPEQAEVLQQLGCGEGQGFLFWRALPFAELRALL